MGRPRLKKRHAAAVLATAAAAAWISIQPSNDRDWAPDNAVLPYAELWGDSVRVHNVRNARYTAPDRYTLARDVRAYDLRELESAWFLVEPFDRDWRGPAHTLVSFGFRDGRYLAVSVEIRKERGESYSPVKGLLKRFELTYVVADERDVIALRANHRKHPVHLYPIRGDQAAVRQAFVEILQRVNGLREKPEFYNTLTNTCTTNLVRHVNSISPERVPFSFKVLLPGYSDRLAYDVGLIDTELPFEEARARFQINARAERAGDSPDFSRLIRQAE